METVRLRAVLGRCVRAHGLGEPVATVEEATVRAAGIYGSAPTCYLSMATRVRDFDPAMLDAALYERRTLVRIPAMRGSGYMLPPNLVPYGLALAGRRPLWTILRSVGVPETAYGRIVTSIEALLKAGPKTTVEIRKALRPWTGVRPDTLIWVLRQMSREGRIVAARVRGGWRSQLFEHALLRDWVEVPAKRPTLKEALQKLAPLYFAANGPATLEDFGWWAVAGNGETKAALDKVELERVLVDKLKGIHLAAPASLHDLADPDTGGALSLLPYWDAYVMAHADRKRYLDAKWSDHVVDRGGNVTNTILRDGKVVGVWDCREGTLRFAPFEPLRAKAIREAAACYARLFDVKDVVEVRSPKPLALKGQNAFMQPLR